MHIEIASNYDVMDGVILHVILDMIQVTMQPLDAMLIGATWRSIIISNQNGLVICDVVRVYDEPLCIMAAARSVVYVVFGRLPSDLAAGYQ